MKKIIAFAMSAVLAVSAVAIPVSAEPVMPFSIEAQMQQARPVSAEELPGFLAEKSTSTEDTQTATLPFQGMISSTNTEEILITSTATARSRDDIPVPVLAHVTATTIVLEAVEGYGYSVSTKAWQDSNVFTNLKPNTTYKCYLTSLDNHAVQGKPLTVTTRDRSPCTNTPKAPMVEYYSSTDLMLVAREGYEYRMNDGEWSSFPWFNNLQPDTEYTFYQRIMQTNAELASEASEPLHFKTAHAGPSSSTNMMRLMNYVDANGFVNDEGNKTLAYVITDEEGTEYYFLVINHPYGGVTFDVYSYSEAEDALLFNTEFMLGHSSSSVRLLFAAALYSGDTCLDYVGDYYDIMLDKYHIGDKLTFTSSSTYLSSKELSELWTMTSNLLLTFWDKYLYDILGFGFRGLSFVATEGYGDLACNAELEAHYGDTVIKNQWEAECLLNGSEGAPYCTLCGQKIKDFNVIPCRGYHVYDNDCDADCNDCGEKRFVPHIDSFACDTECDICGAERPDPLALHKFNKNACTVCGQKGGLLGDATGEGAVNMGDVSAVYAHIRGTTLLTDPVLLAMADVTGDGSINMGDVSSIIAHVRGTQRLW